MQVSQPAVAGAEPYAELKLFIAGEWVSRRARKTQPVVNPATGETLGELPHASAEDLDRALDAAQQSFPKWRAMAAARARQDPAQGRATSCASARSTSRASPRIEEGKTLAETRMEVGLAADIFDWYAEEGRRAYGRVLPQRAPGVRMTVVKEPVGPVAAFAPWNFPIGNPARKIGAALGAGCTCILKPAEETPGSALEVARALVDAGLPKGVLSVVFGVPAFVSTHLISSPIIRAIRFTGSVPVGKQLMKLAADGMKRTTMELGGHGPVLVFDDVDVEQVLDLSVGGEVSQRRPGVRLAHALLRAREHLRAFRRRLRGARESAGASAMASTRRARWVRWRNPRRLQAMEMFIGDARTHGGEAGCRRRPAEGGRPPERLLLRTHRAVGRAERCAHHERRAVRPRRDHQSVHATSTA